MINFASYYENILKSGLKFFWKEKNNFVSYYENVLKGEGLHTSSFKKSNMKMLKYSFLI